eukprot:m.76390 g.76390  ORF g.76390 m.76390 type:complete len:651 (+) comp11879_c0_seq1:936-2888(+)
MYQSLEELVENSISLGATKSNVLRDDVEMGEEIYDALQSAMDPNTEEIYNDIMYSDEDNIYSMSGVSPDDKRRMVMAELLETEKNYVNILQKICNTFKPIMQAHPKLISRADINIIFSNIHELLDAHVPFLEELEGVMQKQHGRVVGVPFLNHMNHFRCYGHFCTQIPEATEKLNELSGKSAAKILDEAKRESKQRFALKDLLNVPMQRVLKYPLLIKSILKHTPDSHPDKVKLEKALEGVQQLATHINDRKKDYDNMKRIANSLQRYKGRRPIQEFGTMVKDGDLCFKSATGKEKSKLRFAFLFTNGIIVCKQHGSQYTFKEAIEFTDTQTIEEVQHWTLPKDDQNAKYSYLWALKEKNGNQHIFAAKTMPIKRKWVSNMQQQLDGIKDAKSAPPDAPKRDATLTLSMRSTRDELPPTPMQKKVSAENLALPPTPLQQQQQQKPHQPQGYMDWTPQAPVVQSQKKEPAIKAPPMQKFATNESWFAGRMPRFKAEKVMEDMPDGSFLVRESDGRPGEYSLTIKYLDVKHIKINRRGARYNIAPDSKDFPTIDELVDHFQVHSLSRHFPSMETTLSIPFRNVGSTGGDIEDSIGRARARFPYQATNEDEISFERGAELQIVSMSEADEGWWRGRLPSGQTGLFPANYVQRL